MSVASLLKSISLSIRKFLGYQKLKEEIPGLQNIEAYPWNTMTLENMAKALEQYRETGEKINYLLGYKNGISLDSGEYSTLLELDLGNREPNFGMVQNGIEKLKLTCTSLPAGFAAFSSLAEVELIGLTEIPTWGFYINLLLKKITMEGVTEIGQMAFQECGFEELTLPNSCLHIRNGAFKGCRSMTTFSAPEVTSLSDSAFSGCTKLANFSAPKVTVMSSNVFTNCTALKKLRFDSRVETIFSQTFKGCSSLTTLILAANEYANETYYTALRNIDAFEGTPIANGTGYIYVPDDLVGSYKIASNWSQFAEQIKPLSEYVEEVTE